jgi:hypothetical protein
LKVAESLGYMLNNNTHENTSITLEEEGGDRQFSFIVSWQSARMIHARQPMTN